MMLLCILFLVINCVNSELFTSVADLETLESTHNEFIHSLEDYLKLERRRMKVIKSILDESREFQKKASVNKTFLRNPVNAFLLIKQLTKNWQRVEQLIYDIGLLSSLLESERLPDDSDLLGVAAALMRLQDIYKLDTFDIAQGNITGLSTSTFYFSASDCFELGRVAYTQNDYYHTVLWMEEALYRAHDGTTSDTEILEYLAYATYQRGGIEEAISYTRELLDIDPTHERATQNLKVFQDYISEGYGSSLKMNSTNLKTEYDLYEMLCRGESVKPLPVMHCRYNFGRHPYLRIAPMKEEEISAKPKIVIFYNIVTKSEVTLIQQMAKPMLERSAVQQQDKMISAPYRISKTAWLYDQYHPTIKRVHARIHQLTGLSLSSSEQLQVSNYGVGGHYEPHYDATTEQDGLFTGFESLGNRIATLLIYLTDVEAGGATVFPYAGVTVWPLAYSGAFWYNLYPSGDVDKRTLHAACPVLSGSKWVTNKWFHERDQEFRRPCRLSKDAEI